MDEFIRIDVLDYTLENETDLILKTGIHYFHDAIDPIKRCATEFCDCLAKKISLALAKWHYVNEIPLATFYFSNDKSNICLETPYIKFLESGDDEILSISEVLIGLYIGKVIIDSNGDYIWLD